MLLAGASAACANGGTQVVGYLRSFPDAAVSFQLEKSRLKPSRAGLSHGDDCVCRTLMVGNARNLYGIRRGLGLRRRASLPGGGLVSAPY